MLHRLFFAAGGLLVLLLLFDSGFPCGEKLVLMEAQVAELVALFPQKLGVVVDLRRVYLVFQLHLAGAAGLHLVLAGFDLSAQLGPAAALLFAVARLGGFAALLGHFPISAGEYASPMNKGAFVNKLDYVILASLEVDTHFNCNVVVGSDGIITGAQGGHPDTAQGAKCTIVIAPLLQGRIPAICTDVTTVTTPGESVDIVVTDYGVAVNPRRPDLLEALKAADCVPLETIEELRDIAYSIVGEPEKVQFGDRIVGIIEARDGTVMDVVREVKPFSFRED